MNNFKFKNSTDIRFGKDLIDDQLNTAVKEYGKNVLLVYGGGSIKKSGLYDRVIKQLDGLNVTELNGVEPNPKIESVRAGQKLTKENDIDIILAVGGGSVIDAAKVIASSKFYDGDPWDLVIDGAKRQSIDQLPLIDILTLSATGTEMNLGSVISNPETNQKLATFGTKTPAVSFLDPSLTYSVSEWQTAAGSIDIFSHLTEQYFDQSQDNDVKENLIEGIMKTVIKWAPIAIKEPENYDARANLMWSSTMALNGLASTGNINAWTVHPIEHELSAYYDITHGVGLGILTPRWMNFVLSENTKSRFVKLGKNVWNLNGSDDQIVEQTIQSTYDWVKSLNVPTTLPGVEINDSTNFEAMTESAVNIGNLKNAYVPMNNQDVINLFQQSMTTEGFE